MHSKIKLKAKPSLVLGQSYLEVVFNKEEISSVKAQVSNEMKMQKIVFKTQKKKVKKKKEVKKEEPKETLPKRLRWLRAERLELSIPELSACLQLKASTLRSYEHNAFPLAEALSRFHKVFAVDLNWLLFGCGKAFMDGGAKTKRVKKTYPQETFIFIDPLTSKRFREIRVALKKDPQVFALDLGIGRIDLGAIENSLKSPRRKELEKLYREFNVDMNYLIAGGCEMFLPNPITKI